MPNKSAPELSSVLVDNYHFFVPAVFLALLELFFSRFYDSFPETLRYEYSSLFSILLICSVPLSVLNPTAWFSIFMTTFVHMLFLKGFFSFALLSALVLFLGLAVDRIRRKSIEPISPCIV
ncbi:unnamed protein product [Caenorhabditis sp. 36 PRJEB53466]|nr:unnamed protein product [Caenorhabditis sp. 36 PRJEB53466]